MKATVNNYFPGPRETFTIESLLSWQTEGESWPAFLNLADKGLACIGRKCLQCDKCCCFPVLACFLNTFASLISQFHVCSLNSSVTLYFEEAVGIGRKREHFLSLHIIRRYWPKVQRVHPELYSQALRKRIAEKLTAGYGFEHPGPTTIRVHSYCKK